MRPQSCLTRARATRVSEIKATSTGKVVLAGNDERADGDFVAVSMDVMCAAKFVLVSAAGAGRAPMVTQALSGDFGPRAFPYIGPARSRASPR